MVTDFTASLYEPESGGYRSVHGREPTLYGTSYGLLTRHYLGHDVLVTPQTQRFLLDSQDAETGYFIGPELRNWTPPPGTKHDREHLLLHLACAVLPVLQQFGLKPQHPLRFAHRFCDSAYLAQWLEQRDMTNAWLEGNNLLFVGQLLIFLRDIEKLTAADEALKQWLRWLDSTVDPATGLWGTAGQCSAFVAMCGGYHQLLVYYYEGHAITSPERLIDTALELQHVDGGFSPEGGGGACEDADAVDILVNLYKLVNYRRPSIRAALRRVLEQILALQNRDGGFPYKRGIEQSHMGIEATKAPPDTSTMFATWFRVHTLALIAEILTDDRRLADVHSRFNDALSMRWHRPWGRAAHRLGLADRLAELTPRSRHWAQRVKRALRRKLTR